MALRDFLTKTSNIDTDDITRSTDKIMRYLNRPGLKAQMLFLNEVEAFRATGSIDKIDARIKVISAFRYTREATPQVMSKELSLSQKLELLNFDSQAIIAVANSEKTGNLKKGIQTALDYYNMLMDIKQSSSGKVYIGCALVTISTSALFFLPAFIINTLRSILSGSLKITTTFATDLLFLIGENQIGMLVIVIATIAIGILSYIFREDLLLFKWFRIIFSPFVNYYACKRSLRFLAAWVMYRESGVPLDKQDDVLRDIMGNRVFERIKISLSEGEGLAQAISQQEEDFAMILSGPIESLAGLPSERFSEPAKTLIRLLVNEQKSQANKLAITLNLLGAGIAVMVILLIVFGMIFPILSIQASI